MNKNSTILLLLSDIRVSRSHMYLFTKEKYRKQIYSTNFNRKYFPKKCVSVPTISNKSSSIV